MIAMQALSAETLLRVWEQGSGQHATRRALLPLIAAYPAQNPAAIAHLSIGRRDALLLDLYGRTFGSRLVSVVACPQCGDKLELDFHTGDLQLMTADAAWEPVAPLTHTTEAYTVEFRLPHTLDIEAVGAQPSLIAAEWLLLQRCLLRVEQNGQVVDGTLLPPTVTATLIEAMAAADPLGDIQITLSCSQCRHEWSSSFDIVTFFWSALQTWTHRIFREVHLLARAYGWREADILALSPQRRRLYLQMVMNNG